MNKWMIAVLLLALPQLSQARVYMCVDEATGATSFTDKACETAGSREEVRVDPANLESGDRYAKVQGRKTWNSQRDNRKSGLDYNAERRAIYQGVSSTR